MRWTVRASRSVTSTPPWSTAGCATSSTPGCTTRLSRRNSGWQPTWPTPGSRKIAGLPVPIRLMALDQRAAEQGVLSHLDERPPGAWTPTTMHSSRGSSCADASERIARVRSGRRPCERGPHASSVPTPSGAKSRDVLVRCLPRRPVDPAARDHAARTAAGLDHAERLQLPVGPSHRVGREVRGHRPGGVRSAAWCLASACPRATCARICSRTCSYGGAAASGSTGDHGGGPRGCCRHDLVRGEGRPAGGVREQV